MGTHTSPLSHSIDHIQTTQHHHPRSNSHTRSQSHSHSHSPVTTPHSNDISGDSHSHGHSHSQSPENYIDIGEDIDSPDPRGRSRHSRGSSLQIPVRGSSDIIEVGSPTLAAPSDFGADVFSPLTPSYKFGHDEHYDAHHFSDRAPNLHAPDLHKPHAHEGHSHNMRGVFLHVMAVSPKITCMS
jgi:solute carrier family 30 (zinc transporter), member 5/7